MAIGADERRIIELVLKASGATELKAMQRDLAQLRQSAQETQASMTSLAGGFANAGKMIAGLGIGALATEGLSRFVDMTARAIEEMDDLAVTIQKTGVAAEDLQKLQYAAALSNVDIETLNKAMGKLAVNVADISGKASPATKALRDLGITAETGTLEAMEKLADQFASMPDGMQKSALAAQLFGKGVGSEMIPLLNEGSEGLKGMAAEADALGVVLSEEALAGAAAFDDEMTRMQAVVDANVKQFVGGLAPALVTIVQELVNATIGGTDFADVGMSIGDALVAVTAEFIRCSYQIEAWTDGITASIDAAVSGFRALGLAATGNLGAANDAMADAKASADAATYLFKNAAAIGEREGKRIRDSYAATRKAIAGGLGGGPAGGSDYAGPAGGAKGGGGGAKGRTAAVKEEDAAVKSLDATMADITATIIKYNKARDEALAKQQSEVDALERAANPMIEYTDRMAQLAKLKREAGLSELAYRVAAEEATQAMYDQNVALRENSQAARDKAAADKQMQEDMDKARDQWGDAADAMGQATYDMISGTKSVGRAVKEMVATIIAEFVRMQAIKALAKGIGKLFGLDPGVFSASGNAFGSSGLITVPTVHGIAGGGVGMAGERGPEAIMPLQRNAQGQLGVASAAANVTVNNYAGTDVAVRQTDSGLQIDIIRRQLAEDVRRGGTSFSAALEATYRVGRQASAS